MKTIGDKTMKNEIKELGTKIRSLKNEIIVAQRAKKETYRLRNELFEFQNKFRYLNMAYTLIKKTKRNDLSVISENDILNLILLLKIETKYNKTKLEEYDYTFLFNRAKNIKTTIKYDLLKIELERIYNAN